MSEALKPCPFCGASARLMGGPEAQESYSVWCTAPLGKRHHLDGLGYNADKAISAWNARPCSTLRTVLDMLNNNASRDNIRRVIEAELGVSDGVATD